MVQGLFLWKDAPGFEDELIVGFTPGADINLNLDNPVQSGLAIFGAKIGQLQTCQSI